MEVVSDCNRFLNNYSNVGHSFDYSGHEDDFYGKKKYLVKVHDSADNNSSPNVIQVLSIKDIFQVSIERHNMNRFEYAKIAQTEYLKELREKGGDIHFYKKTNFNYRYEREVIINIIS